MAFSLECNTCCCGCSIQSGTSILLWTNGILGGIALILCFAWSISFWVQMLLLIILAAVGVGIYAVSENKPQLLMPYLVVRVIFMVADIVTALVMIFAKTMLSEMWGGVKKSVSGDINMLAEVDRNRGHSSAYWNTGGGKMSTSSGTPFDGVLGFLEGVYYFILLLQIGIIFLDYHFMIVVLSCVKLLERESGGNPRPNGFPVTAPTWTSGPFTASTPAPGFLTTPTPAPGFLIAPTQAPDFLTAPTPAPGMEKWDRAPCTTA